MKWALKLGEVAGIGDGTGPPKSVLFRSRSGEHAGKTVGHVLAPVGKIFKIRPVFGIIEREAARRG